MINKRFFSQKYEFGFIVKAEAYQFNKNGNSDFRILFHLKNREMQLEKKKKKNVKMHLLYMKILKETKICPSSHYMQ